MDNKIIKTGVYKHFKGGQVLVLCCAKHSDRDEVVVVYKGLNDGKFYARPLESFCQIVEYNNQQVERFSLLKEQTPALISIEQVQKIDELLNN